MGFQSNVNGAKIWSTGKKSTSFSAVAKSSVISDGQKGAFSQQGAHTKAKHLPEAFMLPFVDQLLFLGTAGGFIWVCSLTNSYGGWLSLAVKESEISLSILFCQ